MDISDEAVRAARSRLNRLDIERLKVRREFLRLDPEELDGSRLRTMKETIQIIANYGPEGAAEHLAWVLRQMELSHQNAIAAYQMAGELLEENYRLKTEAQVELRDQAEFVLATAGNADQAERARRVVADVNEWMAISAESLSI